MKKAKHIRITSVVIVGTILLSNAFVLVAFEFVLSPEGIFEVHDATECIRVALEKNEQRDASEGVQLHCHTAESLNRKGK